MTDLGHTYTYTDPAFVIATWRILLQISYAI